MGTRSDFDILRILSHQLAQHGLGQAIRLRTPEAAFDEIRQHVPGYDVSLRQSAGRRRGANRRGSATVEISIGSGRRDFLRRTIRSSPAAALSRYCTMIQFLQRGQEEKP